MSQEKKPKPSGWNEAGVVGERRFVALLYNEAADALLAHFERTVDDRYPVRSIYMKRRSDAQYAKVFGPNDVTSAVDVVSASRKPLAFFHVDVVASPIRTDAKGVGFNWSHIGQIDLTTGSVSEVIHSHAFRQKHHGAWMSDILAAADDGRSLLCRVGGLPAARIVGDEAPSPCVNYSLCRVTISTSDVQIITPLPSVFF